MLTCDIVPVLSESFNNNNNNWLTDNNFISGKIEKGNYLIGYKNFRGTNGLSYKSIQFDLTKDFEIGTSIQIINGIGGLIFGVTEEYDHYRIEITKNELAVVRDSPSKNKIVSLYSVPLKSFANSEGSNKIILRKNQNTISVLVNDRLIKNLNDIFLKTNNIGFSVGLNSQVSVDYMTLTYMQNNAGSVTNTTIKQKRDTTKILNPIDLTKGPEILWSSPTAEKTSLQDYSTSVKATSKTNSGLEKVICYVNGISAGESGFQPVKDEKGLYSIEKLVTFRPSDNTVYFIASDGSQRTQRSEMRYFSNPEATPPEFIWAYPPETRSTVNVESFPIKVSIKSPSGFKFAWVLVNGIPYEEIVSMINPAEDGSIRFQRKIILKDGENNIYISATNEAGTSYSEGRIVILNKVLAEKRLSLIIGNGNYLNNVNLKNPINYATLRSLNFDIIKGTNLGLASMMDSIRKFSRGLSSYNVALFYYAGYGMQVEGINYLIQVDAKLNEKNDCSWEVVPVTKITDEFNKHATNTNIVILDACRKYPYRSWVRGDEVGFKAIGPVNGTIISFATSEG
jgi:hypothetical protein